MEVEQLASDDFLATSRCAVVTGGNKGIGFEICRQLASKGVRVVLTARDETRGREAVKKLSEEQHYDVVFHQLDVTDLASVARLADFVGSEFGKLDILINNAGIAGGIPDADAFAKAFELAGGQWPEQANWKEIIKENGETAQACLKTNYYGVKATTEALLPLLRLSDSPRIVNVTSTYGLLKFLPNGWAKETLSDLENLTEERIDEVLSQFLKDFGQGDSEAKGWPTQSPSYKVSKAAANAYTRILAKKNPKMCVNGVCPGYVKTDITCKTGLLSPAQGAEPPVRLALLPKGSFSGLFFFRQQETPF